MDVDVWIICPTLIPYEWTRIHSCGQFVHKSTRNGRSVDKKTAFCGHRQESDRYNPYRAVVDAILSLSTERPFLSTLALLMAYYVDQNPYGTDVDVI